MYDVLSYSHQHSNHLTTRETRTCMMSSGILIKIWITLRQEKRGHVYCLQVFSSRFELHFDIREANTCMMSSGILIDIWINLWQEKQAPVWFLQVFSSIFELSFDIREKNTGMMSSGILIDIRITFDKTQMKICYGIFRYFTSIRLPSTKKPRYDMGVQEMTMRSS